MGASGDGTDDLQTYITGEDPNSRRSFSLPTAPSELQSTRWLPYSESFTIAGIAINKGFVYLGPTLLSPSRGIDPALIDPRQSVAPTGHYGELNVIDCRSYSTASPTVRRAYLQWLADGRSAPDANIALVFLYFYGLERRIILDVLRDGIGTSDFPNLYKELKRLYTLYAAKSPLFRRHCAHLIELVEVAASEERLYERDLTVFPTALRFPFIIRLALGQAVEAGVPIPGRLALSWVENDPSIVRPSAVVRCPDEFRQLFLLNYAAAHGNGLTISPNRTKLKLSYQPASAGLSGCGGVDMHFGQVPDVFASTEPVQILQDLVNRCANKLEPYSRHIARYPDGRARPESVLILPAELWSDATKFKFETIKSLLLAGPRLFTFSELAAHAGVNSDVSRELQQALISALKTIGIGMEPELSGLSRKLESAERLVLFQNGGADDNYRADAEYSAARLSVELAAIVAHADGDFCERELDHLNQSIESWNHLPASVRVRLKACACLLRASPVTLASMKRKISALDIEARADVARFVATMVLADGIASTAEVGALERIYQQFGLDREKVYRDIHTSPVDGEITKSGPAALEPFRGEQFVLDAGKIAALQISSREIALRLARIFSEEPDVVAPIPSTPPEPASAPTILGLDPIHSKFAHILISRSKWDRAELLDVAVDLAIMLDGALERMNEASLDQHDAMFVEGDDPIEINQEIVEKLT